MKNSSIDEKLVHAHASTSSCTDEEYLRKAQSKGKMAPFISHIRFPYFKNLEGGTKIEFTFPITALVGQNGTNKSSVLRALFGAPEDHNIGDHWFSTAIDPIKDEEGNRHCYIYGYHSSEAKQDVEVLLQRSPYEKKGKKSNPDYWESSRPVKKYGMAPMPEPSEDPNSMLGRSETRWNLIQKNVDLLDFRSLLSAFDKFFYHNALRKTDDTPRNKKKLVRGRAPRLMQVIDSGVGHDMYYGIQRVVGENRILTPPELREISTILGKDYDSITLTRHRFYDCDGYTARMKSKNGLQYTEAFAGSGEFAAIMLVVRIMKAQKKSLILLDEPEVSLHPGAQSRLMAFLTIESKKNKHQIVISTHSPAIIRNLPPDAIKVLALSDASGKIKLLAQKSFPESAFLNLGEPIGAKKIVIVEDRLAKEFITYALRYYEPDLLQLLEINYFPGGASALFTGFLPFCAAENRKNILCILDGDQGKNIENRQWPNESDIPTSQDAALEDMIQTFSGVNIQFPINSGTPAAKEKQSTVERRRFIQWSHDFVRYLPGDDNPEGYIIKKQNIITQQDPKDVLKNQTAAKLKLLTNENPSGEEIFSYQKQCLVDIVEDNDDMRKLADTVKIFFHLSGN